MKRLIFTEFGQSVSRKGVLGEATALRNTINDFFGKLADGSQAMKYMAGGIPFNGWMGRVRNSKNMAKDDAGASFLIEFLFKESNAIAAEKGFRFNLLTPKEHRECGGSGFGLFAGPNHEYDNMPVPLANLKLNLKDWGPVTIEEIRAARELEGMPTIDADGFVTGEIIKRDSYHFLLPDAVAKVKEKEKAISSALEIVSAHAIESISAALNGFLPLLRRYLRNVGEGEKRLSTPDLLAAVPRLYDMITGEQIDFSGILAAAKSVAFALGYRDKLLTPHEIMIAGRKTDAGLDPHIPLGIQVDKIDKELIGKKRVEERWFTVYTDAFSPYGMYYNISLEPLLKDGTTVSGPKLISLETGLPSAENMKFFGEKCREVPFARPGDWYFKG